MTGPVQQPQAAVGTNAGDVVDAVTTAILAGASVAAVTSAVGELAGVSASALRTIFTQRHFAVFIRDAVKEVPALLSDGDAADAPASDRVRDLGGREQARARAAYLVTATVRLAKAYATGNADVVDAAKKREDELFAAHEAAAIHRSEQLNALADAVSGKEPDGDGRILLGWHADDNPNQCARCAAADGKNFDALAPPPIGWPGFVHPHCFCAAGAPFAKGGNVDDVDPNLRDVSGLAFGRGSKLWKYWTVGKGTARYLGSPHPWTALRDALIKEGVPANQADGLATNIMMATPAGRAAFKAHHGKGRSEMKPEIRSAAAKGVIREYRAPSDAEPDKPYGFTARAVQYGVEDSYHTSWQRGVFKESLEKRMPSVVWGHNWNDPIGRVVAYRDNEDGLDIDVELDDFDAVPRAKQAYAQLRSGTMDQFSFAFKRAEEEPDPAIRGCTRITKASVDEFSVVLNGAVPGTHTTSVRSDDALAGAARTLSGLATGERRGDFTDALKEVVDTLTGLLEPEKSAEDDALDGLGLDDTEDPEVLRMAADADMVSRLEASNRVTYRYEGRIHSTAKPYGSVKYADPGYQSDKKSRYPLDTKEHVQAAWSYINKKQNAAQYSAADLAKVKAAILAAAKKFGIETADSK